MPALLAIDYIQPARIINADANCDAE